MTKILLAVSLTLPNLALAARPTEYVPAECLLQIREAKVSNSVSRIIVRGRCASGGQYKLRVDAALQGRPNALEVCTKELLNMPAARDVTLCKFELARLSSVRLVADLTDLANEELTYSTALPILKIPTFQHPPQIETPVARIESQREDLSWGRGSVYSASVPVRVADPDDDTSLFELGLSGKPEPLKIDVIALDANGAETVVRTESTPADVINIELSYRHRPANIIFNEKSSGELRPGENRFKFRVYDAYGGPQTAESDIVTIHVTPPQPDEA